MTFEIKEYQNAANTGFIIHPVDKKEHAIYRIYKNSFSS